MLIKLSDFMIDGIASTNRITVNNDVMLFNYGGNYSFVLLWYLSDFKYKLKMLLDLMKNVLKYEHVLRIYERSITKQHVYGHW